MKVERRWLEELVFSGDAPRRFTQDSPILPDVWLEYGENASLSDQQDLLLTPYRQVTPAALAGAVLSVVVDGGRGGTRKRDARRGHRRELRNDVPPLHDIASNQSVVAARLSFDEMVQIAAALGSWPTLGRAGGWRALAAELTTKDGRSRIAHELRVLAQRGNNQLKLLAISSDEISPGAESSQSDAAGSPLPTTLLWFVRVVGTLRLALKAAEPRFGGSTTGSAGLKRFKELAWSFDAQVREFARVVSGLPPVGHASVFLISRNRPATPAIERSVVTVKADAARRLFQLGCDKIAWAIVDSGVDATHPAFRRRDANGKLVPVVQNRSAEASRVIATYDFTRIRSLLNPSDGERREALRRLRAAARAAVREDPSVRRELKALAQSLEEEDGGIAAKQLRSMLSSGRMLDWSLLEDLVRIDHDESYLAPRHDHGTHVAGILAADWQAKDYPAGSTMSPLNQDLVGVCPDIRLVDLRVFDTNGASDEFAVMAALQFIRWLNGRSEQPMINGANLSLSIRHDVTNFACGRTPVCEECSRLVNSGVIVVAAAGNAGRAAFTLTSGESSEGYRSISISDPGNTEDVITVGATHRHQPHTYGVSYFSSRGPTGDGRSKPDLVAPGERIESTVPGVGAATKDGTSQAAPHVSGAAALLLARHRELLSEPRRVKEILCASATDLRRERYFQGAGLVDVLRAIQSV